MAGEFQIDALLPADMAAKAEQMGVRKANLNWINMFALAVLAGAFICARRDFCDDGERGQFLLPRRPTRRARFHDGLAAGLCALAQRASRLRLGLILVMVGGAELFTGNNLIVMAWANRKVSTGLLLKNWVIVYLGNFVGSLAHGGDHVLHAAVHVQQRRHWPAGVDRRPTPSPAWISCRRLRWASCAMRWSVWRCG